MPETEEKGGLARKILAIALSALAARLAMTVIEKAWTRGLRRDLPEMSDEESLWTKVAWIGLTAAAVGVARELAKGLVAPKTKSSNA